MYLAVVQEKAGRRYELRRSVPCGSGFVTEVLVDLGQDPGRMVRFGRFGMSYAEEILSALAPLDIDLDAVDAAFAPYAPQGYSFPGDRTRTWRRTVLNREQERVIRALHPFDRRRMAYLRSGEVNLGRIDEVNPRLFRCLVGKCRDELEQFFWRMERELPRDEVRTYVYAAFNLQRHFATLTARIAPEALDQDCLDDAFLREFCVLAADPVFWGGLEYGPDTYLRRYACLHFDFDFPSSDGFRRIFEAFRNDFRRPPTISRPMPPERVREMFGLTMAEIRSMSRRDFARIFRKKAMSMHPDKGGEHDRFVELLEAYKRLVKSKPEQD